MIIMSRYPITETLYRKFVINGKPHKIHHGDYYAHKGVGLARILTPVGMIDVYNTHLHASYVDYIKFKHLPNVFDEYLSHRVAQAFELAQFVRSTAHNPLAILAGDMNSIPSSVSIKCIKAITGFTDAHAEELLTFGTLDNTFGANKYIEQKLDYIYYKRSNGVSNASNLIYNEKKITISHT